MTDNNVFVEVRNFDGETVKRLGPMNPHKAEKVERGLLINMNHDAFYTDVIPANGSEE